MNDLLKEFTFDLQIKNYSKEDKTVIQTFTDKEVAKMIEAYVLGVNTRSLLITFACWQILHIVSLSKPIQE